MAAIQRLQRPGLLAGAFAFCRVHAAFSARFCVRARMTQIGNPLSAYPIVSPSLARVLASAVLQISDLLRDKFEVVVDMVRVDLDDLKKGDLAALCVHPDPRERLARE